MDAAKAKHGVALTVWAEDHGKKRNVRTLLSTMHTVCFVPVYDQDLKKRYLLGGIEYLILQSAVRVVGSYTITKLSFA